MVQRRVDPNGRVRFVARWREPGSGRDRSKTFELEREAKDHERRMKVAVGNGSYVSPDGGRVRLAEWATDWLAMLTVAPSTIAQRESYVSNRILPELGEYRIGELSPVTIRRWARGLLDAGLAHATAQKCLQILSQMLADAERAGRIARNPAVGISLGSGGELSARKEHRYLSMDEVEALADAIRPEFRAMVFVGALAGLRIGEMGGLRRSRISGSKLRVDRAVVEVGSQLSERVPKTRGSVRTIAMPERLVDELLGHVATFGVGRTPACSRGRLGGC